MYWFAFSSKKQVQFFSRDIGLRTEPRKVQGPELNLYTHMHTLGSTGPCTPACTWGFLS